MFYSHEVNYFYSSEQDFERLRQFSAVSGDKARQLLNQYVRGWMGLHRARYERLAVADSDGRGLAFSEWGRIVVHEGFDALPGQPLAKPIEPEPLSTVVIGIPKKRVKINNIVLSLDNYALLQAAIFYSQFTQVEFMSRVVAEHLERNWERFYERQIAADDLTTWDARAENIRNSWPEPEVKRDSPVK